MADVGQRDRTPFQLELTKTPWPAPPLNLFFTHGYRDGLIDLSWDDPAIQTLNSRFQVLGVNVYRSFDSEFGPFERITELPVGATFWRDQTENVLEVQEDVSDQFILFGDSQSAAGQSGARYVFQVLQKPIVKEASQQVYANMPSDVHVYVDGVEARVLKVIGFTGDVEIDANSYIDVGTQKAIPPVIPVEGSRVTCTYRYTRSLLKTNLFTRVFYRVTTVALPKGSNLSQVGPADLIETPLENAAQTHTQEIEKLDAYWREGIRRNRWILEQGGERVKLMIRKTAGVPCPCIPDDYHNQPVNDCLMCYGTGIVGGYEGPYDIIVAPDDAERRISQTEIGRKKEHTYEVWTGPTPLLSMRDFIVKQNNDRYSIGPVRSPSNRGMVLQQHFNIGIFDGLDIRAKVPMGDPIKYVAVQFGPAGPEQEASSAITDKPNIPMERQLRGRTKAWENGM